MSDDARTGRWHTIGVAEESGPFDTVEEALAEIMRRHPGRGRVLVHEDGCGVMTPEGYDPYACTCEPEVVQAPQTDLLQ